MLGSSGAHHLNVKHIAGAPQTFVACLVDSRSQTFIKLPLCARFCVRLQRSKNKRNMSLLFIIYGLIEAFIPVYCFSLLLTWNILGSS